MFFPYSFGRQILDRTYILDQSGHRVAQLQCRVTIGDEIVQILVWSVLSIVTCGLASIFYAYRAFGIVLNNTMIVPLAPAE